MTAPTLYSIEDDLLFALGSIESVPDDEPGLRAELEEQIARLVAAEISKVDGIARMLAHFEFQADLAASEIKRLQLRKKSFENSRERLESCARLALDLCGKTRLEGETSTISLQKNPPAVFISDFAALPDEYIHIEVSQTPDKDAIKRAIRSGSNVPGAELIQTERLVIR